MKNYRITPDIKLALSIMEAINQRGGYCPCTLDKSEDTLCMCNEFVETGNCRCGLFIIKEEG